MAIVSRKEHIVCGLDIGSTKICMLISRIREDGSLEILGTGYAESAGLKRGMVTDLDQAAASVRKAAGEAEAKSGVSADWVTVGMSGEGVQSFNCHGAIEIEGKNQEVTRDDMIQVIRAAQSIPAPENREVIHVLPQEFFLDNWGDITNPVGLTGKRLDVDVHVVTCDSALLQNLVNAVNKAQMRVNRVILQNLASAEAVLTREEREMGASVIDIGGSTTDLATFGGNSLRATAVLPVGGLHFTRDLAIGLRTPIEDAERLKKEIGALDLSIIAEDETITVPGIGTRAARSMPRKLACKILLDRAVELLELIKENLAQIGERDQSLGGAVLTGGGSLLAGLAELAEQVLEMPVRSGLPLGVHGLTEELVHPVYATAVGLALLGAQQEGDPFRFAGKAGSPAGFIQRVLSWVEG
jgi:cell division protein FtsA